MKRLFAILLVALAFEAGACGICIDDKIASCYDHAVVTGAKAKGHAVAFFAIKGEIVVQPETRRAVLPRSRSHFDPSRTCARSERLQMKGPAQWACSGTIVSAAV